MFVHKKDQACHLRNRKKQQRKRDRNSDTEMFIQILKKQDCHRTAQQIQEKHIRGCLREKNGIHQDSAVRK